MDGGTIVVGTDGMPAGDRAVRWAAREAVAREAVLRIVHVFPAERYPGGCDFTGGHVGPERQLAAAVLIVAAQKATTAAPAVRLQTRAVSGRTEEALVSATRDATLLVVGGHGRAGLSDVAACPVVVVPDGG